MRINERIRAFVGHKPSNYAATYEELSKTISRCTFLTPTRGEREIIVNLSVDEIEDLILAEDQRRKGSL